PLGGHPAHLPDRPEGPWGDARLARPVLGFGPHRFRRGGRMRCQRGEEMSTQIRPAPVRKTIFVNAPQAHAFDVFTSGIGRWWPKTHSISEADLDRPVIEPHTGGRWYELGVDGSECEGGQVPAWDPPGRHLLPSQ